MRCNCRTVACAVAMLCLTAASGWGQGSKPDRAEESGQAGRPEQSAPPTAEREPEAPQTGHPLVRLADSLRAQAQRTLDRIAAENGNNETAIVGRFQVQTEYRDLRDSNQALLRNVARFDIPIGDRFLIRTDVPFYNARFTPSDASSTWSDGLGDIFIRMGALVYDSPGMKLFAGGDVIFPTSEQDELGQNKYSLGPGIAISAPVAEWDLMTFFRFQHIVSIGGDPSEKDVDLTRLRFRFSKSLSENWWVHAEPEVRIDWNSKASTAVLSQFEIGRKLDHHWRLFMRPAVGITGNDVPGSYDWFIRLGVRYMF
jgi:hypothetical protein